MKQPIINITLLHELISDRVKTKKPLGIGQINTSITREVTDDPGAQYRSLSLPIEQLKRVFALTVIQYVAHCVSMRALQKDVSASLPNIFEKYEKKNRGFTMYDCIDILQSAMAEELAAQRQFINPIGEQAYL